MGVGDVVTATVEYIVNFPEEGDQKKGKEDG